MGCTSEKPKHVETACEIGRFRIGKTSEAIVLLYITNEDLLLTELNL